MRKRWGARPIGLWAVGIAKAAGAKAVYATDINPLRLDIAREMGATLAINSSEQDPVEVLWRVSNNIDAGRILIGGAAPSTFFGSTTITGGAVVFQGNTAFGVPGNQITLGSSGGGSAARNRRQTAGGPMIAKAADGVADEPCRSSAICPSIIRSSTDSSPMTS